MFDGRMHKLRYALLAVSIAVTFLLGGGWRVVALGMVVVGVGLWMWERRHLPRVIPLVLVAALLIPSLTACGTPDHPIPLDVRATSPTADGNCVVAVATTIASGIYTVAEVPLNWVGVALFGTGLPSLAACQSEFTESHVRLQVWYDCGQGPRYFIVGPNSLDYIHDVFANGWCSSETGNYIPRYPNPFG